VLSRLVVCGVLVVVTEGKCDVFGVSSLLLSRAGVIFRTIGSQGDAQLDCFTISYA
jgi:hypothetical protein